MDLQKRIVDAIADELERQASSPERGLSVTVRDSAEADIRGPVDLDKLAMVVAGTLAGGP